MSKIKLNKDFLGKENKDGFNFPISEEKIKILLTEKNNVIKNQDVLFKYLLLIICVAIFYYFLVNILNLNQQILEKGMLLIMSPVLLLLLKRKSRWELIWINFLLERNNELMTKKSYKEIKWSEIIF